MHNASQTESRPPIDRMDPFRLIFRGCFKGVERRISSIDTLVSTVGVGQIRPISGLTPCYQEEGGSLLLQHRSPARGRPQPISPSCHTLITSLSFSIKTPRSKGH